MSDMTIPRIAAVAVLAIAVAGFAVGFLHDDNPPAAGASPLTAVATSEMPSPPTTAQTPAATVPAPPPTAPPQQPSVTVGTSPVTAPVSALPAGPRSPSVIGAQAVALISYPWAHLGYQLTFHGPKSGFLGLTDCTAHTIDIYVTPSQTVSQVEYITAFEIAHAVDCTNLSPAREAQWPRLRGFEQGRFWYPNCSCSENSYASGDFSDVFALWQAGPVYPWRSALAPQPSAAQLATLVPFLEA
jgi:hypothetical protein